MVLSSRSSSRSGLCCEYFAILRGGWCFANPANAKTMRMEASLINDLMYIRRAMLKSLQKNEEENDDLKEQILALEYHLNKLQSTFDAAVDEGDTSQNGRRWDIHDVDIGDESLVLSKAWGTGKRMLESTETATTYKRFDQRGTSDYKRLYDKALMEEYAVRFIKTDGRPAGRPPTGWRGSEEEAKAIEFLVKKREES